MQRTALTASKEHVGDRTVCLYAAWRFPKMGIPKSPWVSIPNCFGVVGCRGTPILENFHVRLSDITYIVVFWLLRFEMLPYMFETHVVVYVRVQLMPLAQCFAPR